ncbi:3'-5' exonuclease [Spirosoma montaniterrae]|uniref:DNA polymerase III subunit epsilon n=1 Tax=Spirosoma montaniterrae TaxID=1178516 RepID=A0A1P9WUT9_9BACT|nr:3'-5' exonuclease [Spirosoma montaniterrae]AQG79156.1 DNA polymerase III subunit epsilon [Spirosoma montaniterrae]
MPYLVLDLEMTGPEPDYNEIIQIGAVLFDDDWTEKGRYLTNVYPENEDAFSSSSEKIHNLSLADLEDAPMMYDVLPAMEEWICKQLGIRVPPGQLDRTPFLRNVIICGQSVINDINFLKEAYRYEKLKWPYSRVLLDLHTLAYFTFRVLKANGRSVPDRLSLTAIANYFGFAREDGFHNALEDAVLTAQCLKEVFKLAEAMQLRV